MKRRPITLQFVFKIILFLLMLPTVLILAIVSGMPDPEPTDNSPRNPLANP